MLFYHHEGVQNCGKHFFNGRRTVPLGWCKNEKCIFILYQKAFSHNLALLGSQTNKRTRTKNKTKTKQNKTEQKTKQKQNKTKKTDDFWILAFLASSSLKHPHQLYMDGLKLGHHGDCGGFGTLLSCDLKHYGGLNNFHIWCLKGIFSDSKQHHF